MSLELLQGIQEAETKADQERGDAQREAREIVKGVTDACLENERRAAVEHRALFQSMLEEKRTQVEQQLAGLAEDKIKAREEMMAGARQHLSDAADFIAKRVLSDGHR